MLRIQKLKKKKEIAKLLPASVILTALAERTRNITDILKHTDNTIVWPQKLFPRAFFWCKIMKEKWFATKKTNKTANSFGFFFFF